MLVHVLLLLGLSSIDPSYDGQKVTYNASLKPVEVAAATLTLTPFFSPEHSTTTLVELIASATSTLDIQTPGISSWSGCTYVDATTGCMGCKVEEISAKETFPLFNATLNAIHRGVQVRIITNNYGDAVCRNKTDLATYLVLAGASLVWYRSTTFVHAKFMLVDNATVSISSINWSKNSFINNREAGVLVRGAGAAPLLAFARSVFERDWAAGLPYTPDGPALFSITELASIANATLRPIVLPPAPTGRHYTPSAPIDFAEAAAKVALWISPDFAQQRLLADLANATSSVELFIYQVTSETLCETLIATALRGVVVDVLVSASIYGAEDQVAANVCYARLAVTAGVTLRAAYQYDAYFYNHNKYWIVDGITIGLSTGNWCVCRTCVCPRALAASIAVEVLAACISPLSCLPPPCRSPSDYPDQLDPKGDLFPTFAESSVSVGGFTFPWRKVNRDFTIAISNAPDVVAVFASTMVADRANATLWTSRGCRAGGASQCGLYAAGEVCQCDGECSENGDCCFDYLAVCAILAPSCYPSKGGGLGCGFDASRGCQCDSLCTAKGDCCADYDASCSVAAGSCAAYGCGAKLNLTRPCQCTDDCAKYKNCCADFDAVCSSAPSGGGSGIDGVPTQCMAVGNRTGSSGVPSATMQSGRAWRISDDRGVARFDGGVLLGSAAANAEACATACCADAGCAAFQWYHDAAACAALVGPAVNVTACCGLLSERPSSTVAARPASASAGSVGVAKGDDDDDAVLRTVGIVLGVLGGSFVLLALAAAAVVAAVLAVRRVQSTRALVQARQRWRAGGGGRGDACIKEEEDGREPTRSVALSGSGVFVRAAKQPLLAGGTEEAAAESFPGYSSLGAEYRTS